jgi:triacylglycerol lipase
VDLLGPLKVRSAQLAKQILDWGGDDPIYLLAHSMGGLDCRRVIAQYPEIERRVRRLVTIATPHYGSPVADAVLDQRHPLRPHLPGWLLEILGANAGALEDLTTRTALQDADKPGIEYLSIGCNRGVMILPSPLFTLTRKIGLLTLERNDGVVTLASAAGPRQLFDTWPVDHGGAIGWPTDLLGFGTVAAALSGPQAHIKRYMDLLPRLVA